MLTNGLTTNADRRWPIRIGREAWLHLVQGPYASFVQGDSRHVEDLDLAHAIFDTVEERTNLVEFRLTLWQAERLADLLDGTGRGSWHRDPSIRQAYRSCETAAASIWKQLDEIRDSCRIILEENT